MKAELRIKLYPLISILVFCVTIHTSSYSQTVYTTTGSGLWTDAIWSPSVPPTISPADGSTIKIKHDVTMTSFVRIQNPDSLIIESSGSLTGSGGLPGILMNFSTGGGIYIDGNINIERYSGTGLLTVSMDGTLSISGIPTSSSFSGTQIIDGTLNVSLQSPAQLLSNGAGGTLVRGAVNLNNTDLRNTTAITVESDGALYINNGDFIMDSDVFFEDTSSFYMDSGSVTLASGMSIFIRDEVDFLLENGDFNNNGSIRGLARSTCVGIRNGDFNNSATGQIDGKGGIILEDGNINDAGLWQLPPTDSVEWCVQGTGTSNAPAVLENCSHTCSSILLPIGDIVDFKLIRGESNRVLIHAKFILPDDVHAIHILKGESANELRQLDALNVFDLKGSNSNQRQMEYLDISATPSKVVYYQLLVMDINGNIMARSLTRSINIGIYKKRHHLIRTNIKSPKTQGKANSRLGKTI